MAGYPKTSVGDLTRLIATLIKARARRGNLAEAAMGWLRSMTGRYRSPNLVINLLIRRVLFVSGPNSPRMSWRERLRAMVSSKAR